MIWRVSRNLTLHLVTVTQRNPIRLIHAKDKFQRVWLVKVNDVLDWIKYLWSRTDAKTLLEKSNWVITLKEVSWYKMMVNARNFKCLNKWVSNKCSIKRLMGHHSQAINPVIPRVYLHRVIFDHQASQTTQEPVIYQKMSKIPMLSQTA